MEHGGSQSGTGCKIKELYDPGTLYFGLKVGSERTSETLQDIGIRLMSLLVFCARSFCHFVSDIYVERYVLVCDGYMYIHIYR